MYYGEGVASPQKGGAAIRITTVYMLFIKVGCKNFCRLLKSVNVVTIMAVNFTVVPVGKSSKCSQLL